MITHEPGIMFLTDLPREGDPVASRGRAGLTSGFLERDALAKEESVDSWNAEVKVG
jgi:hypothetical protein